MDWVGNFSAKYDELWSKRDTRVDGWFLLSSPIPTAVICLTYVYIVKIAGPNFMKNRQPLDLRNFLIVYNAVQVLLSAYIFYELIQSGWWNDYSFRCQPVDYSNDPKALRMASACWWYFFSKFTEFFDTFCFVARKKNNQVSLLHVVHHGIMPMSVWPGARFTPGGHASFFGLCNSFIHILMYLYYMISAMGPKYQKYCWWKQHMTTMQMIQFVMIMAHGFQLAFYKDDCGFPWQFSLYIGAHAILFFVLFSQFYVEAYLRKKTPHPSNKSKKDSLMNNNNNEIISDKKKTT